MSTQSAVISNPEAPAIIPCFDPATGERLGEMPVLSAAEVTERVARARAAQENWARTTFADRRRVLRRILDHVLAHADELCDIVVRDAGKTREHAMLGEIWPVCEKLRHTIAHGERHLKPERVSSGILMHKKASIEFRPLGIIGVICPWNYPLQNVLGPVVPALFAGNAVIVKVSEWTSWSAPRIQQIFDEVLRGAGYPTDLVQVITGDGQTGAALVSGGVDKVIFTGSIENGRRVIAQSAKTLTPVILELGGKDAFIVCDDAHIERAAHAAMVGVFMTSGQSCLAAERVLVFDGVFDAFSVRVTELTRALRQGAQSQTGGEPVDVGAMTTPAQLDIVEGLVNDAVNKGAKVLVGGARKHDVRGSFYEPTVLTDVRPEMAIMHEETFGPVMVLVRVKDEDEAIAVANDTQFGLSCTVMSRNAARAKRIADRVASGSACVNDFGLAYMAQDLPFGGVRGSGFGRLNGREGLRACTNIRAVLTDRFMFQVPAKIFPVGRSDYATARGVIRLLYGRVSTRWRALRELLIRRD